MRTARFLLCTLAVGTMSLAALAQTGDKQGGQPPAGEAPRQPRGPGGGGMGGGPVLSPEKAKAAWSLEATGVAKRLGLDDTQTKALVTAYSDARTSHTEASDKIRKEVTEKATKDGGDRGAVFAEMQKATADLNKAEREKFQKAIAGKVPDDKATKAMASLGTFNRAWDNMADSIAGFNLEAAKQQDALVAIEDYVVAQEKTRSAGADGDREAMRTAMQESRTKLTDSLKKVLSEDQMKKFQESMQPGGRGGRGQGGPGGPPGDDKK